MKMFMLKSLCLAAVLLIAVLTGMQLANNGIQKMKGYDDPSLETAVSFQKKDNQIRASVLGNDISSHDIAAKKKKLEEISAFNFFSSMGRKMSDGITGASEKLVHFIAD
ncbi:YqxA family protein [Neobacillus drentensis]|uniref:YqxA family protein n=1 Tax=Neobacillus drentensis TaxID=220684 RepID=UPI002FFE64E2